MGLHYGSSWHDNVARRKKTPACSWHKTKAGTPAIQLAPSLLSVGGVALCIDATPAPVRQVRFHLDGPPPIRRRRVVCGSDAHIHALRAHSVRPLPQPIAVSPTAWSGLYVPKVARWPITHATSHLCGRLAACCARTGTLHYLNLWKPMVFQCSPSLHSGSLPSSTGKLEFPRFLQKESVHLVGRAHRFARARPHKALRSALSTPHPFPVRFPVLRTYSKAKEALIRGPLLLLMCGYGESNSGLRHGKATFYH